MEYQLMYRLQDKGYTVYHRAALGGLAATIHAWQTNRSDIAPLDLKYEYDEQSVSIGWGEEVSDKEAIMRLLAASFRLTSNKLIDLPGLGLEDNQDGLRVAIHNGITGSFLQHNKMRPGEKENRTVNVAMEEDDVQMVSYKGLYSYAHQTAQGTDLFTKKGGLSKIATIPQSLIPGSTAGSGDLQASWKEVYLLLYLIVGSPIYLLRPRIQQEKLQTAIIVPYVTNLIDYTFTIKQFARSPQKARHYADYDRRIVGGAQEAGIRFVTELSLEQTLNSEWGGVGGCMVVTMGKVSWDNNQINRSSTYHIGTNYEEIDIYLAAYQSALGGVTKLKTKKEGIFAIPSSSVPALVASNLASERHWCAGLLDLVKEQKDFRKLLPLKGGFQAMKEAIRNKQDRIIIEAFHEAWRRTMGQMGERARREGLDFTRQLEVEQEKIRNTILRLKTSDSLANWFLRFCASATGGGTLSSFQTNMKEIHAFITDARNYERFQNLCLFALLSYTKDEANQAQEEER
ncbi:type I-MYXAN CRISPR-associated Cas8a1/Cmx1 [Brevibacillus invocatus]|nr:type I-MYXAN CRISPR-associated Cas8a1/Cmx1 [Brevibacillus invocatus]